MDGRFVPNLTFGAKVIETIRKLTSLPLDVHLMVVEPESYFDSFAKAGASNLTIHAEVAPHLNRQLARIRELGCSAGVAINPSTSIEAGARSRRRSRRAARDDGESGIRRPVVHRELRRQGAPRATAARRHEESRRRSRWTAASVARRSSRCWRAGADTFVAGNAVFAAADPRAEIGALRALCTERA